MVRFVGSILNMDNREELLDALNEFSRKQSKEIPVLLEQFLKRVAKTGETLFPWTLLKNLFVAKLEQVMTELGSDFNAELIPPCPNVENARFEVYRTRIMEAVNRFHGAPFTIQRLCELLTDPRRHYKRCDKFLRGLEKNILVVSTVDPFGRKVVSESKNLVNGMEGGADDNSNSNASSGTLPPPVPAWNTSSTATVWPHNADAINTSTAPLLEVSDLLEPGQVAGAAPNLADAPPSLDGLDVTSTTTSGELPTDSTPAVAAITAAESESTAVSSSAEVAAASSVVTAVTSESAVDSCEQQVAAEEMVGMEDTASNVEPPPEPEPVAAEGGDMLAEGVGMMDQVMKDVTEVVEASDMVAPSAGGDWLSKIDDKGCKAAPVEQPVCDNVSTDKGLETTTITTPAVSMDLDSSSDLHKLADTGPAVTSGGDTEPGGLPQDVSHSATAPIQQHSSAEAIEPESSSMILGSSGPACHQGATDSEALPPTFPLAETSLAASESSKNDSFTVGSTDQIGDPVESLASGNSPATLQCDETDGGEPTSSQSTDFVAVVAKPSSAENQASVLDSAKSQALPPADDISKTAGSGSADEVSNMTGFGTADEVSNTAESDSGSLVLGGKSLAVAEISSSVINTESSAATQQQNGNTSQEQLHQDNMTSQEHHQDMTSQEQQHQGNMTSQEHQHQDITSQEQLHIDMTSQEQLHQDNMTSQEQPHQDNMTSQEQQHQDNMTSQEHQHQDKKSQEQQQQGIMATQDEKYVPDSTPQHEAMEQD